MIMCSFEIVKLGSLRICTKSSALSSHFILFKVIIKDAKGLNMNTETRIENFKKYEKEIMEA